jgi:hypothetical protein
LAQLIRKLRGREEELDPVVVRPLVLTIARNGVILPRERGLWTIGQTFRQAAIFVAHLLRCIPAGQERETLANEVLQDALPLPFAYDPSLTQAF